MVVDLPNGFCAVVIVGESVKLFDNVGKAGSYDAMARSLANFLNLGITGAGLDKWMAYKERALAVLRDECEQLSPGGREYASWGRAEGRDA